MAASIEHVTRGLKAGAIGGLAFGLFVALVGNPLVSYAETFEHGHGGGPVVPETATIVASVGGGVFLGILLGAVVFGAAFYVLEPAIPGPAGARSYLLGAAGFVTVSGSPWVLLPPQPPGVEQALATEVRLTWYAVMMAVGAAACILAGYAYSRLRARHEPALGLLGALVAFGLIPAAAVVGPANPVTGPIPADLAYVFRSVTATGQVGLWLVLAGAHALLLRRDREADPVEPGPDPLDRHDPATAD